MTVAAQFSGAGDMDDIRHRNYNFTSTSEILVTS
jgi:hypothetical protein